MESAVAREETRRLIVGALKARLEAAMESIVSVVGGAAALVARGDADSVDANPFRRIHRRPYTP